MQAVNLGEVYCLALRRDEAQEKTIEQVTRLGIEIRRDLDDDFIQLVGKWKVGNRLAYADAFVLAPAECDKATVRKRRPRRIGSDRAAQGAMAFLWFR